MENEKPKVLNKRDNISLDNAVYVGRPTDFGNPFSIGINGTREEVIAKYRKLVLRNPDLISKIKKELKGKNLVCWCSPLPCHADVLLEIANE